MTDQKQNVGAGAEAYQAKRDIIVHNGATPEQMAEIIGAITRQLSHFTHEAKAIADQRCEELKKEILEEIARPGDEDRSGAFRDPDFQFVLGTAIESYARKGTDSLRAELVRLLMERASHGAESRISYVLNEAIGLAGRLTTQDRALLVTLFAIKTVVINAQHIDAVYLRYQQMLNPYVNCLPITEGSFDYLSSIGCISIERVADHFPLDQHFHRLYGKLIPEIMMPAPAVSDQAEPQMIPHTPSPSEVFSAFKANVPALEKLVAIWDNSLYRHSVLTGVGKALAHSVLTGDGKIDAALDIFVN